MTVQTKSSSFRLNFLSSVTKILINKSPDGPPYTPASPLPAMRSSAPSNTPLGILIENLSNCCLRDWPLQVVQGDGIVNPSPPHMPQVWEYIKNPWLN